MNFDMDAFLNDLKVAVPSEAVLMMSLLHHLWENSPLKLSTGVALIALSPALVLDIADIQRIYIDPDGDYRVNFKSNDASCYVVAGTPEWTALQVFIATLPTKEH